MLLTLAQSVQTSELSKWLAGSTWAYPLIGALHVLGIAWFGGGVLLAIVRRRDAGLRPRAAFLWAGGLLMLVTGLLLFIAEPVRCVSSFAFGAKMLLLVTLAAASQAGIKLPALVTLALWAGVLIASRGIAYF